MNLTPRTWNLGHDALTNRVITAFTSPQLELIELDDEQWVKFQRRPSRTYTKRTAMVGQQLSLLDLATSALFLLALKAI